MTHEIDNAKRFQYSQDVNPKDTKKDIEIVLIIVGFFIVLYGSSTYRIGMVQGVLDENFTALYIGILITIIGFIFMLVKRSMDIGILMASIASFLFVINSWLFIGFLRKIKEASISVNEAAEAAGLSSSYGGISNPETIESLELINLISLYVALTFGIILLIYYIHSYIKKQKDLQLL